ncbi:unnamed protein product [Urochloa humidicola]
MPLQREQTPHPNGRRPTVPVAASRFPVHAVPFSPHSASSPPPSATPTPPPTPFNLPPFTSAFDPLNMLASSSSSAAICKQVQGAAVTPVAARAHWDTRADTEEGPYYLGDLFAEATDKGKGILGARPPTAPPVSARGPPRGVLMTPMARDIRMVGRASPEACGRASPPVRTTRSPPSPASPVVPTLPPTPPAAAAPAPPNPGSAHESDEGDLPFNPSGSSESGFNGLLQESDDVEEESVESDDLDDGPDYVEVWVEEGDWDRAARFAFVDVTPVTAAANPAPLIRGAFIHAAPQLRFQMWPSSRGVSLMYFGSAADREAAMAVQPVPYRGSLLKLQRVEETDDRFIREPAWVGHIVCWNYPEEHWDAFKVKDVFECIGTVREIDPQCIPGTDRSCLRFLIELQHPRVPNRVGVHPPSGRGLVLEINGTSYWPRQEQIDENGNWIPFFGPPPPPAAGFDPPHLFPAPPQILPGPPAPFGPAPPPAPQPLQPMFPGAFQGASILCHGFINAFPLPRMPSLPILLHLPTTIPPAHRACTAIPMLLLTWRDAPPAPANDPAFPPPEGDVPLLGARAPPRRRRGTEGSLQLGSRNSERIAARDKGKFVRVADKAAQLKELQNSLTLCSKPVQNHVQKKKLLKQTKKPIAGADLRKLSEVVGLGASTAAALGRVLGIAEQTGQKLDQVLAGQI